MELVDKETILSGVDSRARELREAVDAIVLQARALEASVVAESNIELTRPELLAIEILGSSGPCIMRSLAQQLFLAGNSVTKLVDNLERKDLVRRDRDSKDRRLIWVHLTDHGREVHVQNVDERTRLCRALLDALSDEEQETLLLLNGKIAQAAREFVAHSQGGAEAR